MSVSAKTVLNSTFGISRNIILKYVLEPLQLSYARFQLRQIYTITGQLLLCSYFSQLQLTLVHFEKLFSQRLQYHQWHIIGGGQARGRRVGGEVGGQPEAGNILYQDTGSSAVFSVSNRNGFSLQDKSKQSLGAVWHHSHPY